MRIAAFELLDRLPKLISKVVEERPELKDTVSQIEARYEAKAEQKKGEITPLPPEVEKFLRELGNPFNRNEGI